MQEIIYINKPKTNQQLPVFNRFSIESGLFFVSFMAEKCFVLQEEGELYRGEQPISLPGCNVEVAATYTKRRYVFSLRLPSGTEFLFQARDDVRENDEIVVHFYIYLRYFSF